MSGKRFIAVRDETCLDCGFCRHFVSCSKMQMGRCIGCGACIKGCPQGAIRLQPLADPKSTINFTVDGKSYTTQGPVSVLEALRELGRVTDEPGSKAGGIQPHCSTGGCWNCAVLIDGVLDRSCVIPLREKMEIITTLEILQQAEPKRTVTLMRPAPHYHPSVFTHGCNYHCDLCHNWNLTFSSSGSAIHPKEAVTKLDLDPERDSWVGISGGEPTLNRAWLTELVKALHKAVPDSRIQLDTNASLLTPDYIDELAAAGITDISPDLKALHLDTFIKACGTRSEKIARQYLETSWNAVRYLNDTYSKKIFMAVSLPCHPRIHSKAEIEDIGRSIAEINPEIPVTLIEYQPAFQLRDWPFLSPKIMEQAQKILESAGLHKVIVQGGPEIPRAVDPAELALCSEEF
ncbi:MAG TPA: radical SAM protein [Desulfobacterales bacterium]|nr:radical SAM protein [Desulfobacterales bacterium]